MTLQKVKEKGNGVCLYALCLCLDTGSCIDLYLPVCKWCSRYGKDWLRQIFAGAHLAGGNGLFGIFPMIIGSIYVTAGAIIVGVQLEFWQQYFWQGFALNRYTAL